MLWPIVRLILVKNFAESFIDNVFRDKVIPKPGCVVYCDLVFGIAEHSGVYVGNNQIVQLSSSGVIEKVSPTKFIEGKTAISIYVSCKDKEAAGDQQVADRACSMIGKTREYKLLSDNCHQFSTGCLTGDFDNSSNYLWILKDQTSDTLGSNTWRVWDLPP